MAAFAKDARATDCQSGKPQMHWPKEGLRNTFVILYSWFIETKSSNCNWEDITVKDMRDVSITTQHENALSIVYNALYLSCTLGVDFPKPKGLDLNSEVPRNGGDLCHPYDKARYLGFARHWAASYTLLEIPVCSYRMNIPHPPKSCYFDTIL